VDSLRQHIFTLAFKLNPRPGIPDEAQRYFFGSQAALQEWKDKGDIAKLDDAIEQLNEALRIAPWWPEAYFNRGLLLEDRGRYADAVENLKLYLLAAPGASDATQVQQKIYMLEYKAREAQAQK
jgi:tetratricopeptide (TPR) repeat protein